MSQPESSRGNRRPRQSLRETIIPTQRRRSRTNARQRVVVDSGANAFPEKIDVRSTWGNWASVEDLNYHRINEVDNADLLKAKSYVFCGSPNVPVRLYTNLNNAHVKACIVETKWHHVVSMPQRRNDQKCVLALIERWWDTTHTFHLPQVEIGFTPYDFTCLTGIPFGGGRELPPFDKDGWSNLDAMRDFFPDLEPSDVDSSGIKCAYLKWLLDEIPLPECNDELEQPDDEEAWWEQMWLRAFFLLVIGEIFFPNNKKWVSAGWCEAVKDPEIVGTFDWGVPILGAMYAGLDDSCRGEVHNGQFFWTVLQYWYYEYIRIPAPVLEMPVIDVYPRMHRWRMERRRQVVGGVDHSLSAFRLKLEEATFYSILWMPFEDSDTIRSHQDCINALNASRCRFPLNYNGICLWYVGDRVWRQLTGVPSIPHPPPRSMKCSAADWDRWSQSEQVPFSAQDIRMDCDLEGWALYWRSVSRGIVLNLRFRDINTDEVNTAASWDYRLLPVAPRVFQGPGPYELPPPCDLTQYYVPLELEVPSTSQRVRIPTEPYSSPVTASPFEMTQLSQQLGEAALSYKKQLTRMYDQHGWPTEEFGYNDDGAGPSTSYPTTGGAPPGTDQPGFVWTQAYGAMSFEQRHHLSDDDEES